MAKGYDCRAEAHNAINLGEREAGFRVFTDPVGHPFCIVFGHLGAD